MVDCRGDISSEKNVKSRNPDADDRVQWTKHVKGNKYQYIIQEQETFQKDVSFLRREKTGNRCYLTQLN